MVWYLLCHHHFVFVGPQIIVSRFYNLTIHRPLFPPSSWVMQTLRFFFLVLYQFPFVQLWLTLKFLQKLLKRHPGWLLSLLQQIWISLLFFRLDLSAISLTVYRFSHQLLRNWCILFTISALDELIMILFSRYCSHA